MIDKRKLKNIKRNIINLPPNMKKHICSRCFDEFLCYFTYTKRDLKFCDKSDCFEKSKRLEKRI